MRILPLLQLIAAAIALPGMGPTATAQDLGAQYRSYMAQQDIVRPGLGDDPGDPRGAPVSMPSGVQIIGKLRGLNPGIGCNGGNASAFAVQVCMVLCNETDRTITLTLPAGTALVNRSSGRVQNGVLMQSVTIRLRPTVCPKGDSRQTSHFSGWAMKGAMIDINRTLGTSEKGIEITEDEDPSEEGFQVTLGGLCLNEHMAPSEDGAFYELGPVLDDPDIRALVELVGDRPLDEEEEQIIQTAMWSITDGRGLTPADRSALQEFRSR